MDDVLAAMKARAVFLHGYAGHHRNIFPPAPVSLNGTGQSPHVIHVKGGILPGTRFQWRVEFAPELIDRGSSPKIHGLRGSGPTVHGLILIRFLQGLQVRAVFPVKCRFVIAAVFIVPIIFVISSKTGGIQVDPPHLLLLPEPLPLLRPLGVDFPAPVHVFPGVLVSLVAALFHHVNKGALRDADHADDEQHGKHQEGPWFAQAHHQKGGKDAAQESAAHTAQGGLLIIVPPGRPCRGRTEKQLQQAADHKDRRHHGRQLHGSMKVALVGKVETGAHKNQYGQQVTHHAKNPQLHAP